MKKGLLILSLIIFLSMPIVIAQDTPDLVVSVRTINSKIGPGDTAEFELKIQNNQRFTDELVLKADEFNVFPFSDSIKQVLFRDAGELEADVRVGPNSLRVVPLKIETLEDVRPENNYLVNIDARSKITNIKYSAPAIVNVISPDELVGISSDFPSDFLPGNSFSFKVNLIGNANVVLEEVEVIVLSELFEERFSTPVFYKKMTTEQINLDIDSKVDPGMYTLSIKAYRDRNLVGSLIEEFEVKKNIDIEEEIEISKGFLKRDINIKKTNTGNLFVEDRIIWPVSSFARLFIKSVPEADTVGDEGLVWNFELKPNQVFEVDIVVDYTGLFIFIVALLLAIFLILYYYNKRVFITKSALTIKDDKGGISELKIQLHIKNRDSKLNYLEVYDIIPNIAEPTTHFGTLKPDKIQKGPRGKRLVWKLKNVEKGEERVISYKIESKLSIVGSIFLPPAFVKYRKNNRQQEYRSNRLVFFSTSKKKKKANK